MSDFFGMERKPDNKKADKKGIKKTVTFLDDQKHKSNALSTSRWFEATSSVVEAGLVVEQLVQSFEKEEHVSDRFQGILSYQDNMIWNYSNFS